MIPVHGGDVAAAARRYGVDAATLLDFSANLSPYGPPSAVREVLRAAADDPRSLTPYPGPRYASVCAILADRLGVEPAQIVVGNGATALVDAAVRAARAPSWIVPVPAFSEYRRAITASGARSIDQPLDEQFDIDAAALSQRLRDNPEAGVVLNRPHNPSGRRWERAAMISVFEACEALSRPLILDEAFIDYDPAASLLHEAVRNPRAVVVRSLTKFYALAGIRIGFAVAQEERALVLRAMLPSWPAGSLDERIACAALADERYERETREQTTIDRSSLAAALAGIGLRVFPSEANYLFIDLGIAPGEVDDTLAALAHRGILVRDCRSYERLERRAFVRVAVLERSQNERLVAALAATLGP
jgi:threonine-phosphate decarboxylase